jgi:hypothetical protein
MKIVKVKYKKYIITVVLGVLLVGILGDNSVLAHRRNKQRIAELKREKARYMEDYQRSQAKIYLFQTDIREVQRVGRELHLMKMPDEDIFVLSDDTIHSESNASHETAK